MSFSRGPVRRFAGLLLAGSLAMLSSAPLAAGAVPATARAWSARTARIARDDLRRSSLQAAGWPGRPFAADSVWNRPLAPDAPLAAHSAVWVRQLVGEVHADNPWLDDTAYGDPVYVVGPRTPTRRVVLDTWAPDLQRAFAAVPIPRGARAAAGTDEDLTVWQPSHDRLWDLWLAHRSDGAWHARWGGEMDDVSSNPGYFSHAGLTSGWGATATGLPLLGGLVTFADLARGSIDHALALAIPQVASNAFAWPAQRSDGDPASGGPGAIPEGMRLRLDPRLDLARLHLPPIDLMLARAAQRYGVVVRDRAGAVTFYGQQPVGVANPWPAAFEDGWPNLVLAAFPWAHLEALAPRLTHVR